MDIETKILQHLSKEYPKYVSLDDIIKLFDNENIPQKDITGCLITLCLFGKIKEGINSYVFIKPTVDNEEEMHQGFMFTSSSMYWGKK